MGVHEKLFDEFNFRSYQINGPIYGDMLLRMNGKSVNLTIHLHPVARSAIHGVLFQFYWHTFMPLCLGTGPTRILLSRFQVTPSLYEAKMELAVGSQNDQPYEEGR
jgi:hypothetical protein